jgi:hypothetical protein
LRYAEAGGQNAGGSGPPVVQPVHTACWQEHATIGPDEVNSSEAGWAMVRQEKRHDPQCALSLLRSVSHPLVFMSLSQSPQPGRHDHSHAPWLQATITFAGASPQRMQLVPQAFVSVSPAHWSPQA